jgi:rSAM/selenodomain-associated transferase 1
VKTRLCPPLSARDAAELYACMLDDVLRATARFAPRLGLAPVLAVHPPEACAALSRGAPTCFRVIPQRGPSLAARMDRAVREAAAAGARRIVLRGSDSPALDESACAEALAALERADLALAPDRDGGYQLVALRRPAPQLFEHPMSTASVLDDTLANARRLGLRAHCLEPGFDVDGIEDLRWLAERRARGPLDCPRTLDFLDRKGLWKLSGGL